MRELKKGEDKDAEPLEEEVRAKKTRLRSGRSLHPSVKFGFMLPSRPGEREREKNCMNLKENREPRAPGTNGNKREEGRDGGWRGAGGTAA